MKLIKDISGVEHKMRIESRIDTLIEDGYRCSCGDGMLGTSAKEALNDHIYLVNCRLQKKTQKTNNEISDYARGYQLGYLKGQQDKEKELTSNALKQINPDYLPSYANKKV